MDHFLKYQLATIFQTFNSISNSLKVRRLQEKLNHLWFWDIVEKVNYSIIIDCLDVVDDKFSVVGKFLYEGKWIYGYSQNQYNVKP